jgi:hypothetical protein
LLYDDNLGIRPEWIIEITVGVHPTRCEGEIVPVIPSVIVIIGFPRAVVVVIPVVPAKTELNGWIMKTSYSFTIAKPTTKIIASCSSLFIFIFVHLFS